MAYESLKRLTNTFSVQDILTPCDQLKRADTFADATYLLHEYDIIPFPRRGVIEGFFQRDSKDITAVAPSHLISNSTNLVELPKLLSQQAFYFVISGNNIIGYVHYSDLNKAVTKIPFFAMFQMIERNFWDKMMYRISEKDLQILFPEQAKSFLQKKEKIADQNVDVGWTGIFSFPYILRLARHYGLAQVTDNEIALLKGIRNKIAHSDQSLVTSHSDVGTLAQATEIFLNIISTLFTVRD